MNVLSLFSGIGAFEKALENLDIKYNLVGFSEIDKYAIKAYCAIHNVDESLNLGDISKINIDEVKKLGEIDLLTHGSPCFIAGTKVITDKGYKNIEDLQIGDMVLTHTNSYKPVIDLGSDGKKDIYKLEAQGILPIYCTNNHPFYIKHKNKIWNNKLRRYEYSFSEPKKVKLCDLTKNNDYIGIPIIPDKEDTTLNLDDETLWLLGRYVADGWFCDKPRNDRPSNTKYTCISVGSTKMQDFENHITTYKYRTDTRIGCTTYRFGVDFTDIVIKYGFNKGATNKNIPMAILQLPKQKLQIFLNGYMSGDGCYIKNTDTYQATTVSRGLAESLVLAVQKVYNVGCKIYYTKRPKKYTIENRIVNQNDTYMIRYNLNSKQPSYLVEDNCVWYPIKKITNMKRQETIFNITVQDNHTYTANNCYVFNCQDYSVAGKQAGGNEGSGTRSSLMWYSVNIIKNIKPKYVIWENVKNVLSKKHIHNFNKYLSDLEEIGYNNYYMVLNAKDYGVPQNRERVYAISIRSDCDENGFIFPEKIKLDKLLKDVLEPEYDVPEKYYLSDKLIKYFEEHNKKSLEKNYNYKFNPKQKGEQAVAKTITTRVGACRTDDNYIKTKIKVIGEADIKGLDCIKRIYDTTGISPTLTNMQGGNRQPKVKVAVAMRGRYNNTGVIEQNLEISSREIANSITTVQKDSMVGELGEVEKEVWRVRKLTPRECFRLMGFSDSDFDKAREAGISDTQLYKVAGNSIVVNVLMAIFKNLFL